MSHGDDVAPRAKGDEASGRKGDDEARRSVSNEARQEAKGEGGPSAGGVGGEGGMSAGGVGGEGGTSAGGRGNAGEVRKEYRYYDLIMAAFVTVLLCSNLIGPGKSCRVSVFGVPFVFGAGNLFFPISYIFGDVLTEVYGYARSRRVIWAGFGALVFAATMGQVIIAMPIDPAEPFNRILQPAIETVFGNGPRIVAASIVAFWAGDFVNSYVLAKMKILTRGKHLWSRFVGSTFAGQAVDSALFYPIAFAGLWTTSTVTRVVAFNWASKVFVEVALTPLTYAIVGALKRAEGEDYFDRGTNFTPFSLRD